VLRNNGANPLLGTTFFKDAFAVAEKGHELAVKQDKQHSNLALKGSMQEFTLEGKSQQAKYLCDRRPLMIQMSGHVKLALQDKVRASEAKAEEAKQSRDPYAPSMKNRKPAAKSDFYKLKFQMQTLA